MWCWRVLAGSSRTTFAGAHVVQGEGAYGVRPDLFLDTDHQVALAGVRRIAHGQRSLALALSRERAAMGFDQLFLDTENQVALAGISESKSVWGGRRQVDA